MRVAPFNSRSKIVCHPTIVVTRGQESSEDEAVYEIHMRLRPNGIWYTERLLRDDGDT